MENQIVTKGFVYEIRCNITNKCYYGSTTSLYRKHNHMHNNSTSSKEIIDGGNWTMKTLETIFYKDKSELLLRERWYIQNNDCVNINLPITTIWEKSEQQSETMRKWYIKNKKKHLITCAKYQETHKEKHAQAMQRYQQKNFERIRIYQRAYRQKQHDQAILKLNENIVVQIKIDL